MFYIKPYNTYTSGTISQSSLGVRFNCTLDALVNSRIQRIFRKQSRRTSFKPILHFLTSKKIREDPQANVRNFVEHHCMSMCLQVHMCMGVRMHVCVCACVFIFMSGLYWILLFIYTSFHFSHFHTNVCDTTNKQKIYAQSLVKTI